MGENRFPRLPERKRATQPEGPGRSDLTEGTRGIVVMPTQVVQPIVPADLPGGVPAAPQNLADGTPSPADSSSSSGE